MKIGVCYKAREDSFITAFDYDQAIYDLMCAKEQLTPDGKSCSVCGDGGHQAWECHHNPLVMTRRAAKERATYRCFHCGQSFMDQDTAADHFGKRDEREYPVCKG